LFRSQKKKKVYCVFTFSHSFFCLIKPLPWCFPYLSISLEKRFYCFAQNVLFWFDLLHLWEESTWKCVSFPKNFQRKKTLWRIPFKVCFLNFLRRTKVLEEDQLEAFNIFFSSRIQGLNKTFLSYN
jgi:hypothetical protein